MRPKHQDLKDLFENNFYIPEYVNTQRIDRVLTEMVNDYLMYCEKDLDEIQSNEASYKGLLTKWRHKDCKRFQRLCIELIAQRFLDEIVNSPDKKESEYPTLRTYYKKLRRYGPDQDQEDQEDPFLSKEYIQSHVFYNRETFEICHQKKGNV